MDAGLSGKVVAVTGAASGIGRETALAFVAEGAHVAMIDIDGPGLAAALAEAGDASRVLAVVGDLAGAAGVAAAFAEVLAWRGGRIDVLVNNAGVARPRPFDALTDEEFEATLQLNFFGYLRAIRQVLPAMREHGGAIVNVASDLGYQPAADPLDYSVSKTAVLAMTKALARAEGPAVRINAVAPGPVWTPLWTRPGGFGDRFSQEHRKPQREAVEQMIATRDLPLARLGTPEEVANVIVFLSSGLASYVSGSIWGVDGGSIRAL